MFPVLQLLCNTERLISLSAWTETSCQATKTPTQVEYLMCFGQFRQIRKKCHLIASLGRYLSFDLSKMAMSLGLWYVSKYSIYIPYIWWFWLRELQNILGFSVSFKSTFLPGRHRNQKYQPQFFSEP